MARPLRLALPAAFLSAVLLGTSCGGPAAPSTTSPRPTTTTTTTTRPAPISTTTTTLPPPVSLRIGITPSLAFGIPFVLAEPGTGIGRANALDVSVEVYATAAEALAAAIAGEVDVVLPDGRALLTALAGGACFRAPLTFIDQDSMRLVGRSDLITADDLIGRKVGTPVGGPGEVALRLWLSAGRVGWDQVPVVDLPAADLPAALEDGRVDAIIWTEPIPARALEACGGEDCRYVGDIGAAYREVTPLNVTCRWQQAHGDDGMTRLVRAWLEGLEYLLNNVDAAAALAAGRLRLTPEEVADRWRERGWLQAWAADLTDDQVAMLESYAAYLVDAGELAEAPDLCGWIDGTWLAEVAPSLVSLDAYDC